MGPDARHCAHLRYDRFHQTFTKFVAARTKMALKTTINRLVDLIGTRLIKSVKAALDQEDVRVNTLLIRVQLKHRSSETINKEHFFGNRVRSILNTSRPEQQHHFSSEIG